MSQSKLAILQQKHQNGERVSFWYDKDGSKKRIENGKIVTIEYDKIIKIYFPEGNDTVYVYAISKIISIDGIQDSQKNDDVVETSEKNNQEGIESNAVAQYYQHLIQALIENEIIKDGMKTNYQKISEKMEKLGCCSTLLKQYLAQEKVIQKEGGQARELLLPFISNTSQKQAIQVALTNQVSVIQGPPGTGKTQTILNLIASSVYNDYRVLIVSKNNSAIDNVAEKLEKHETLHQACIRVGNRQTNIDLLNELEEKLNRDFSQRMKIEDERVPIDLIQLEAEIHVLEEQLTEMTKKSNFLNELKTQQCHIQKKLQLYELPFSDDDTRTIFKKFAKPHVIFYIANLWKNQEKRINVLQRKLFERLLFKNFQESEYTRYIWRLESLYAEKEIQRLETELQDYQHIRHKISQLYEVYQTESIARTNIKIEARFTERADTMRTYQKELNKAFQVIQLEGMGIGESAEFTTLRANATKLYPVVLSTADSCVHLPLDEDDKFDVVIIDEASQADLITFLPVLNILKDTDAHLVIVGDDRQLKNVVAEQFAQVEQKVYQKIAVPDAFRYTTQTVLSSVKTVFQPIETLLREHYRCEYHIINYCNKKYYEDQLIIYSKEVNPKSIKVMKLNQERNSEAGRNNKSRQNMLEVRAIEKYVQEHAHDNSISVISPFKSQKEQLQKRLTNLKDNIGTIHQFQGRENERILFSTVLTHEKWMLGKERTLLNDALINVAISRAQNEFVLFTHDLFFKEHRHHLFDLIRYTETYGETLESNVNSIFAHLYKQYKYVDLKGKHDSLWEKTVFDHVVKSVNQSHYQGFYVAAKVPLADVSGDKAFLKQNPELQKFALHPNAHLDICIVHGLTNQVIFVVEVDGKYHNTAVQMERDRKKEQILAHHNIPIRRIRSKDAVEEVDIKQEVEKILKENQWRQNIFDKMENGGEEA